MAEKGLGISDTFLLAHFVRALPDEYGHVKATLHGRWRIATGPRLFVWSARGIPPCPRRRGRSGRPGRPSKRSSQAKAAAGVVREEVVVMAAGALRAVGVAEAVARVEVAAAEEAAAAPVVPAIVATAAVVDLLAAVGGAI